MSTFKDPADGEGQDRRAQGDGASRQGDGRRGIKALTEPDLIKAAKADLQRCTARTPYVSPLPADIAPPLEMSLV